MEEQVGRVVGNVLAAGGEIFLPEVGSLCVERRRAQRLSRRRRAAALPGGDVHPATSGGVAGGGDRPRADGERHVGGGSPAGRTGGVRPLAGTRPGGGDPDRMRCRRAETGPFHPGRGFRPAAQSAGTCAREGAFRRPARLGDLDRSGGCRGRGRNRRILLSRRPVRSVPSQSPRTETRRRALPGMRPSVRKPLRRERPEALPVRRMPSEDRLRMTLRGVRDRPPRRRSPPETLRALPHRTPVRRRPERRPARIRERRVRPSRHGRPCGRNRVRRPGLRGPNPLR